MRSSIKVLLLGPGIGAFLRESEDEGVVVFFIGDTFPVPIMETYAWVCLVCPFPLFLERKLYLVLFGHFAHVEQGIAHAAQGGVDAHLRGIGNLFEAHVLVVSHDEHFALVLGQGGHQPAYVGVYLAGDDGVFDGTFAQLFAVEKDIFNRKELSEGTIAQLFAVENILFVILVVRHQILIPFLAVMVDDEVVRDACYPRGELARFDIATLLDGRNDFHECFLENVFTQIVVFDRVEYIGVNAVFVTRKQNVECLIVTL